MKIAHIGPACMPIRLAFGGAVERRMTELAAAQAAQGADVRVFSAEPKSSRWVSNDVRYEAVRVRSRRPLRDYEFLLNSGGRLKSDPPDIIHAHNAPDIGRLARRLDVPAVYSFDYFRIAFTRWRLGRSHCRRSLAAYARLLPVSAACGREFGEFWNRPPWPTTVFYNGVNIDQFHPAAEAGRSLKARLGLAGRTVVLYVGRVCEQKGADVLLDAWESVQRRCPEACLVFAGPIGLFTNATTSSPLTARLRRMGGHYLGAVPEQELNSVYNMCDIFVMPTRQDEMFGMAALEAQACGKPVVASGVGGLAESVGAAGGVFVTPGDPRDLASALGALTAPDAAPRRARMGAAARTHAMGFSWPRLAARSREIYESVLSPGNDRVRSPR